MIHSENLKPNKEVDQLSGKEQETIELLDEEGLQDWRQYFTIEELTTAYEKIQNGDDPNDDEPQDENGSDSCPSEGNLDL